MESNINNFKKFFGCFTCLMSENQQKLAVSGVGGQRRDHSEAGLARVPAVRQTKFQQETVTGVDPWDKRGFLVF